jgi:hypothetical protein
MILTIGNGNRARFWWDMWIHGQSPAEIASSLTRFAWRKNQTVAKAIMGGTWMRGLHRISTAEEVNQFI